MRRDEEDHLYQLLMNAEVDIFNLIRMRTDYPYLSFDRRRFESPDGDRILNLSAVNFKNVGLFRSKFIKCNLEVSDLSDTIIRGSTLKDVNLSDSIMIGTKLNEAHLINVALSGGVLTNADLSYCVCDNVDFSYANLANADLKGGYLSGVNFCSANLAGTDLRDSNMVDADLTLCDLSYATYSRRTLGTAKSLRDATFVTIS
jgi:uncharacterized protein YjbI with pentapeptide repeats